MDNSVHKKAKMILAGLAMMPAMGMAATTSGQVQIARSPYASPDTDADVINRTETSGLSAAELQDAAALVQELNQLNVVTVTNVIITNAPRIPYHYNMPEAGAVSVAREKNLERLAKLRSMIEAAK